MGLFRKMPWVKGVSVISAIERVRRDKDPEIQDLAEKTHGILKNIAHSMISSTIKQSFQKMVKNIYVKRLKPIYYYNWPQDETDSPKDRETEKEGCVEENPEAYLMKHIDEEFKFWRTAFQFSFLIAWFCS